MREDLEDTPPTETTNYIYSNDNVLEEIKTIGTQTYRKQYINGLGTDNLVAYTVEELDFCNERVLPFATQFNEYGHTTITSRCDTLSSSGSVIVENTYYFAKNHLGSVDAVTDDTGTTVTTYEYDSYGKATFTGYDVGNSRLFTGREYDEETALYYNRARYYSPNLGRFISRDPIGIEDDINLYSYVQNNPLIYTDRFGKAKAIIFVGEDKEGENILMEAYNYQYKKLLESGVKERNIITVLNTSTINQMNEALQQYKGNIRDIIMVTHSSSEFIGKYRDVNKNDIRKENIHKLKSINENGEGKNVKMTIIGCNAGYGNESIAQDISNQLGINVTAYGSFQVMNSKPNFDTNLYDFVQAKLGSDVLWSFGLDYGENSRFNEKFFTPNY